MRNFGYVIFGLGIIFLLTCSSCTRLQTSTVHSRDTVYVAKVDTLVIPADTIHIKHVYNTVDSVFVEVAADCPNVSTSVVTKWKAAVKKVCTIESLTGGKIKVYSPFLKDSVTIHFKENSGVVILSGYDALITDSVTTTIIKEEPCKEKKLSLFKLAWKYPKEGLLLFFLGFATCSILFFGVRFRR